MCKDFIRENHCEFLGRKLEKPGRAIRLQCMLDHDHEPRGEVRKVGGCCVVLGRFAKGVRESLRQSCHKTSLCLPGMGLPIYLSSLLRHKFSSGIATLSHWSGAQI